MIAFIVMYNKTDTGQDVHIWVHDPWRRDSKHDGSDSDVVW